MTDIQEISVKSGIRPSECSCEKCKNLCRTPCLGTPEDINKLLEAGYGKRLNFDGYGNPCPRNCCAKFNDFARRIKMRSIRGLETQEAKDIAAKYTKSDPDKAV